MQIIQIKNAIYLKQIKPSPPTLNAQPKVHKQNMPIRPLINNTKAPSHKLARHLDKTIRQYITLTNNTSIKNNIDLVNKLQNIHVPHNSTLASFDITNLYTNIPIQETTEILEDLLKNNRTPETHIREIITLTNTITKQNYFTHNNKFYTQIDGVPMGSPISSILAEIFIHHIEQKYILHNNKHAHKILYWHRFVDDIILLYKGNKRQVENFHKYINSIHPKLKFIIDIEKDNSINFLDLTITKQNNTHMYKIYRKPTTTDMVIRKLSNHPTQHKHAAFNHMLHRLTKIPINKQDYDNELNIIK